MAGRLVVRNRHARERGLTVGSETMRLRAPRINDKRVDDEGKRQKFSSRSWQRTPGAKGGRCSGR